MQNSSCPPHTLCVHISPYTAIAMTVQALIHVDIDKCPRPVNIQFTLHCKHEWAFSTALRGRRCRSLDGWPSSIYRVRLRFICCRRATHHLRVIASDPFAMRAFNPLRALARAYVSAVPVSRATASRVVAVPAVRALHSTAPAPAAVDPSELSSIIEERVLNYQEKVNLDEVGRVLSVGDGIARVYGLNSCKSGELLEFASGIKGTFLLDTHPFESHSVWLLLAHAGSCRLMPPVLTSICRLAVVFSFTVYKSALLTLSINFCIQPCHGCAFRHGSQPRGLRRRCCGLR
jgi:ATP synthase alpha/beta family, beta-barrel domain